MADIKYIQNLIDTAVINTFGELKEYTITRPTSPFVIEIKGKAFMYQSGKFVEVG